ncbi:hypothetical protein BDQ12DRAFT_680980 [Crucibulum laeve]|uniref:Uncharacterized protein n=1 Tax=Crucibulum laeve TaxID=68775 RepID=A0A5C3M7P3_9AGAR|nr:hypothetical protein BDQ12DRAFT_680980 [Crucibulum laeve]
MPTATSTISKTVYSTQIPLKAALPPVETPKPPSPSSPTSTNTTSATLRSLYNRAARAFVLRDILLTYSLLESAFSIIQPPSLVPDSLAEHRRKWDILRITLESTVYTSPPSSPDVLPERLRVNLMEAPQALISSIYTRSLELFTPTTGSSQKASLNPAFLPPQVVITLIYSSLKSDCPDFGRVMVEEWLARREPVLSIDQTSEEGEGNGYEKVLELYCLHILPKLEQWDYAKEFLEYEGELSVNQREHLKTNLKSLYAQTLESRRPSERFSPSPSSTPIPRPYSPTPSSSSSSSLSTTSTHTVVPFTSRGNRAINGMSGLNSLGKASGSTESLSSDTTATPHHPTSKPNGRSRSGAHSPNSSSSASRSRMQRVTIPVPNARTSTVVTTPPTTYALIRATLAPYITTPRLSTFIVLFVLVPLLSFVLRIRHRRQRQLLGGGGSGTLSVTSNTDLVRRRLAAGNENGFLGRAWSEVIRAVADTVRMAGSGLV